jgi:DNA repair exonuclease SbcCD ATPase subunit
MEVLARRATKLDNGLQNLIQKTQTIQKRYNGQMIVGLQDLAQELTENKGETEQMIIEIDQLKESNSVEKAKLEDRIKILEQEVKSLEAQVTRLEEKNATLTKDNEDFKTKLEESSIDRKKIKDELKELQNSLKTGQIAFDFERDLATYVYPLGKRIGSRKIFTNMKEWLERKKDTPQGKEANEKWDALQKEFSWSEEHEKVFEKLLKFRRPFAHPAHLELDEAQSQIPCDFNDVEKQCIIDILGIIERVNERME